MLDYDNQYKDLLKRIVASGVDTPDRTGVGVRKVFDANMNVSLRETTYTKMAIPALTLRKVFPRTAFYELLWMLSGSTDANVLKEKGISIWDGNTSREFLDSRGLHHIREGHGGKIYGHQFRNFNGIDQLDNVLQSLQNDPDGRRHYISLWNPNDLNEMTLPPCHISYQFCKVGDELNLKFYQRSADVILGVPMNIMFASFFLHFMAELTSMKVGEVSHSICDAHIYSNHLDIACELIERQSLGRTAMVSKNVFDMSGPKATDAIRPDSLMRSILVDDFRNLAKLEYLSHPAIPKEKLGMAV